MTGPQHLLWDYATLSVDWTFTEEDGYSFRVTAWSDGDELFSETITGMYWSGPLARMGKMGWELVGLNPQSVLANANNVGYEGRPISVPIVMVFFFKRPHLTPSVPDNPHP